MSNYYLDLVEESRVRIPLGSLVKPRIYLLPFGQTKLATNIRICDECGTPFFADVNGITYHYIEETDDVDWDLDKDHAAFTLDD